MRKGLTRCTHVARDYSCAVWKLTHLTGKVGPAQCVMVERGGVYNQCLVGEVQALKVPPRLAIAPLPACLLV